MANNHGTIEEDNAEVLGGVKEYIGVVEQIAGISAIVKGSSKE